MRFDYLFDIFKSTPESPAETTELLKVLDERLPTRLSVVGNAASLMSGTYGREIDEFSTIRFNHAQIVQPQAQGTRWDFVATSSASTLRYYRERVVPFSALIFTPYLDRHVIEAKAIGQFCPMLRCPMRLSRGLSFPCLGRPTTGMQILNLLDRLPRREVRIFGFDWKATPTFYEPGRVKDPHSHSRERRLALALISRNGWELRT